MYTSGIARNLDWVGGTFSKNLLNGDFKILKNLYKIAQKLKISKIFQG